MDELPTIVDEKKPQIVGISETWATESSDMNLNGYHSPIRCDRANGKHGGVALYIEETLRMQPCPEIEVNLSLMIRLGVQCNWNTVTSY